MDELVVGNNGGTSNEASTSTTTSRKALREENVEPQINGLVAAAAAGLTLRPTHHSYMNPIASLHHGICH
jgi:hypothetical protein